MRSKSMIYLALVGAVILSILSIGIGPAQRGLVNSHVTKKGTVLVAKFDILPGERFSSENVTVTQWPLREIPEGAATQLTELQGQVPSAHIYSGEAVLLAKLCSFDCLEPNPEGNLPNRFLVASVLVREDAESRRVLAGDRVDVLAIMNDDSEGRSADTRTVLRNVTVFANLEPDPEDDSSTVRSLALRFDPTQAGQMELVKFAAGANGPLLVRHVGRANDLPTDTETAPVSVNADP